MADQEVTYEDQQKINQFGRLTQKLHELEAQQRSAEKKKLNIQDAMTEMMLADEGLSDLLPSREIVFLKQQNKLFFLVWQVFPPNS